MLQLLLLPAAPVSGHAPVDSALAARHVPAKVAQLRQPAMLSLVSLNRDASSLKDEPTVSPTNVKEAGIDKAGYKVDWTTEWKHDPSAKPKVPSSTPPPMG